MPKSKRFKLEVAVKNGRVWKLKKLLEKDDVKLDDLVHMAVSFRRTDSLAALLDVGCSVNSINDRFKRPIQIAAESGNVDAVPILVKHGAKLGQVLEGGGNVVHLAAKLGYLKFVEYCLKKKPELMESVNYSKETPLHIAAALDNYEIVIFLIKNKANLEAQDEDQKTPLHKATGYSLKKLIKGGANVNAFDGKRTPLSEIVHRGSLIDAEVMMKTSTNISDFERPLEFAAASNRLDLVNLISLWNPEPTESFNDLVHAVNNRFNDAKIREKIALKEDLDGLIHQSVYYDKLDNLELLLEARRFTHDELKPHMQVAAEVGNTQAILKLLQHGSFMEDDYEGDGHLIFYAAKVGSAKTVSFCLSINKKSHASRNRFNQTPLHIAAALDNFEVVQVLINGQAKLDELDMNLRTPLHNATGESLRLLLRNGADVNKEYRTRHLELSSGSGAYLGNGSECVMTPFREIVSRGSLSDAKIMIGNCLEVLDYEVPLKIAAKKNRLDLVQLLVNSGAGLKDDYMFFALVEIAVTEGYIDLFNYLLHYRDDPDIFDQKCLFDKELNDYTIIEFNDFINSKKKKEIVEVIEKFKHKKRYQK